MRRIASEALRRNCDAMIFASVWVTKYEEMNEKYPLLKGGFYQPPPGMGPSAARITDSPYSAETILDDRTACVSRRGAAPTRRIEHDRLVILLYTKQLPIHLSTVSITFAHVFQDDRL
jgi:hypothetical protein